MEIFQNNSYTCKKDDIRVCFWSNTGGAQLVETNVKYFWSNTSATCSITNTSMYVWIYVYLNNMHYIYIYIHTLCMTCTSK